MSPQQYARMRSHSGPAGEDGASPIPVSAESETIHVPVSRYAGHSQGERSVGVILAVALHAVFLGTLLIHWGVRQAQQEPQTLSVFDVAPPAAPPEPESEVPPGPEQTEKEKPRPEPARPKIEPPWIQIPAGEPLPQPQAEPVPDPGPPIERTTAPESKPAPPAQQVSDAKPAWQGLVLGALNKKKHYPASAQRRHEQGVPWIRFVMNREGEVLSVSLERSSGFRSLDEEAVKLPKRAAPLPQPPKEVTGQTIELVVPVEFFLGAR
ncbi:TonB family protein [Novosphingobium beihaiensis]|uniref:TonB family protein n=1 Tax=Novosphingobium beihaiensis TaxID=2930389 RepID=A0ABT0BPQ7_9SPHN|nr:energy transducer TonB [Novosphingobium beihaiensis]MCJ2186689.1 TonB family protein [Novosphingobium beihaiensis]